MKATWAKIAAAGAGIGAVLMFWRKRTDPDTDSVDSAD